MKAYKMGITKDQFVAATKAHQLANNSVDKVRKYFKNLGYHVTDKSKPTANGHDLVIIKGSKSFTVEVKTCFYSARSWKVGKTFGLKNDFIAIVMPSGQVYIEEWDSHKEKCSKNGTRALTKITNLYI